MRDVVVIGVGSTVFGKFRYRGVSDMGREAAWAAIKDANITPRDIEFAYCSNLYHPFVIGQSIMSKVGVSGIEVTNVENACSGGATAFRGVYLGIASGMYDIGIAVGVESMTTSPVAGKLIPPAKDDLDGEMGLTMPGLFAMMMTRHMAQYGTTVEQFARISEKNHKHGSLNPYSQYQKVLTLDEILRSRMICDPLTLLQVCPNTDGAAAVVLCAAEKAKRFTSNPIHVAASVLRMGDYNYRRGDLSFSDVTWHTSREAYEKASLGQNDLDLIELHDPFSGAELMHYEELGLCPRGEGGRLINDGITFIGGGMPVNPSGGLLSKGHPLSATGLAQITEATWQLRGDAGKRQVGGAKTAMTHVIGGTTTGIEFGSCAVHILKR